MSDLNALNVTAEAIARALCKRRGTSQCAAICLSRFAHDNRGGKCPDALRVFGDDARAILTLLQKHLPAATRDVGGQDALARVTEEAVEAAQINAEAVQKRRGDLERRLTLALSSRQSEFVRYKINRTKPGSGRKAMRAALAAAPHTRAAIPEGLSPAVLRGLAERRRQIEVEGWTPEHDDTHQAGELARASGCYAIVASDLRKEAMYIHGRWKDVSDLFWPWDRKWWKPSPDPVRNLEKAFALIVAEMERQDRLSAAPTPPSQGGR